MSLSAIRKLRPWYLVVAMALTSLFGVMAASSSCNTFNHLRGDHGVADNLRSRLEDSPHPMMRSGLVREQARLDALAKNHTVAFPLSIARLLLALLLTFFSGAALAGRRNSRTTTIQIVAANAVLAIAAFQLLTPVRVAMIDAAVQDAVLHTEILKDLGPGADTATVRELHYWAERIRFGALELGTLVFALFALSRTRTKAFFFAMRALEEENAGPPSGEA